MSWNRLKTLGWHYSPTLAPWAAELLTQLRGRVPNEPGMNWILSSGTQSVHMLKAIGLSDEAILSSAESVNAHLQSTHQDRWLLAIPTYHIGGVAIYARAHLSGASVSVLADKWSAKSFHAAVEQGGITLTSLVPTQVHDVVSSGLSAPQSLRAVVVGGGALEPWLYLQARTQGWPLLPSYGLTECASQVATASLSSLALESYPALEILKHVKVDLRDKQIFLQSTSLCRWVATMDAKGFALANPLHSGWLETEDLADKEGESLRFLGRRDSVIKILGVLVPLQEVEFEAGEYFRQNGWNEPFVIAASPHSRRGSRLMVVTDAPGSLRDWEKHIAAYNSGVAGVRRLTGPCWVPKLARGELGKVKRAELAAIIG